ncbi:hypothetical protein Tsubulata_034284 [Turnera subulata]|uniref:Uncharacterized protein n=1 Tax=Turnera subulata TaxID=218843 RepID=A0A9Q0F2D2_9ROSI|nr:hypothetical protein Tsubulata_034284 [Turnera subulata]
MKSELHSFVAQIFSSETKEWREVEIFHPCIQAFYFVKSDLQYQDTFCWNGTLFMRNGDDDSIVVYDLMEPQECRIINMPKDPLAPISSIAFGVYCQRSLRLLQVSSHWTRYDPYDVGFVRVWELRDCVNGTWSRDILYHEEEEEEEEDNLSQEEEEEQEDEELEEEELEVEEEEGEEDGNDDRNEQQHYQRGDWRFIGEAYWREVIANDHYFKMEFGKDNPSLHALALDPYDEDIIYIALTRSNTCPAERVYSCSLRSKEVNLVDGSISKGCCVEGSFQIALRRFPTIVIPTMS